MISQIAIFEILASLGIVILVGMIIHEANKKEKFKKCEVPHKWLTVKEDTFCQVCGFIAGTNKYVTKKEREWQIFLIKHEPKVTEELNKLLKIVPISKKDRSILLSNYLEEYGRENKISEEVIIRFIKTWTFKKIDEKNE